MKESFFNYCKKQNMEELLSQWDYSANGTLTPEKVSRASAVRVHWKCDKGHEWESRVCDRKSAGCPVCANKLIIPGVNDLATLSPELAGQWHPQKNGTVTPQTVGAGSGKYFWWQCERGHEWQQSPRTRRQGNGCPVCANRKIVADENSLAFTNPGLASQWLTEKNEGLTPQTVAPASSRKVWWRCELGHEWRASVYMRSVNGEGCPVCAGREVESGFNDLAHTFPKLAAEWNYTKNAGVTPHSVSPGSGKSFWWRCECGHEWQASPVSRVRGSGCPYCANRKVWKDYNDLASQFPNIAKEWSEELNNGLKADEVLAYSTKKYWWKGKCGHTWFTRVYLRTQQGCGCPECAGMKREVSEELPKPENSNKRSEKRSRIKAAAGTMLVDAFPELAAEFSDKNSMSVESVAANSTKKYLWRCQQGHEWQAYLHNRVNGSRCPYCINRRLLKGYNDLATVRPDLAAELNSELNEGLPASELLHNSQKRVWWKCRAGHEWRTTPYSRTKLGTGCPTCAANASVSRYSRQLASSRRKELGMDALLHYPAVSGETPTLL